MSNDDSNGPVKWIRSYCCYGSSSTVNDLLLHLFMVYDYLHKLSCLQLAGAYLVSLEMVRLASTRPQMWSRFQNSLEPVSFFHFHPKTLSCKPCLRGQTCWINLVSTAAVSVLVGEQRKAVIFMQIALICITHMNVICNNSNFALKQQGNKQTEDESDQSCTLWAGTCKILALGDRFPRWCRLSSVL